MMYIELNISFLAPGRVCARIKRTNSSSYETGEKKKKKTIQTSSTRENIAARLWFGFNKKRLRANISVRVRISSNFERK